MNLGRFIFELIMTAAIWYWYDTNVLSKLDVEEQMRQFEETHGPINFDSYTEDDYKDEDLDYAYDDYDTESDW